MLISMLIIPRGIFPSGNPINTSYTLLSHRHYKPLASLDHRLDMVWPMNFVLCLYSDSLLKYDSERFYEHAR
jgi:hypothetical protein